MTARVQDRVGDFQPSVMAYYQPKEIGEALNCLQNLFAFLTLCFENTETFALATDGTSSYHMLATYPDWILPLRVRIHGGAKLKVARLNDLAALDSSWRNTRGTPSRYAHNGFDLLSTYAQPSSATSLDITYAQSPVQIPNPATSPTATPSIPVEYHQALIDGAIPLLRAKEGGQEWQKTMSLWERYTSAVNKMAAYVRSRNIEQGYDRMPPELDRFDLSTWLNQTVKANG